MDTNVNNKTNSELSYILEYCSDADVRNKAGEQLQKQSPTNSELSYILRWCSDADVRNKAWEQLQKQSPTNSELSYILRWCSDADVRNKAGEQLQKQVGADPIDEASLIKEIAEAVLMRPGSLKMGSWHCGTSHCLAGWAAVLNKTAANIEKDHDTEIAGCVALPNYSHLFFKDDETVLAELERVKASI